MTSLDKPTELFVVITICRHSLHQGVIAFMLKVGESTMQLKFLGWIVFLETIFTHIQCRLVLWVVIVWCFFPEVNNRKFKKTTTATATGTSLNKRFNEQSNG